MMKKIILTLLFLFLILIIIFNEKENTIELSNVTLKQLVIDEIKLAQEKNITGNCKTFAEYYYKTFKEKYPELDVRWIRYVEICKEQKGCLHTFVIVAGYKEECIVDQHKYACIQLK